jgi:multidrug resistance protein, MATE family
MHKPLLFESKTILRIATPIAACTMLEGCVYFLNTWILAQLGNDALGAGALVTNLFSSLMMILWGVFSGSSSIYARYHGADDKQSIARLLGTTNLLALLLGIVTSCILWHADLILQFLGQKASTIALAKNYAHGLALAEIPDLLSFSLFNFLQGISRAPTTLWLSLIYVPLNIACNYILVFGKFGFPALHTAGVGYGTFISYCLLLAIMTGYFFTQPTLRIYCSKPFVLAWSEIKTLLSVGLPLGLIWALSYLFLFLVASIFGRLGADILAAYQIVAQWLSAFFVVTTALATVLKIRIGFALGQKNTLAILHTHHASLALNVMYLLILTPIMMYFSRYLIWFDLDPHNPLNNTVIRYAQQFFAVSCIYLLFYSINYLLANTMIALKDVRYIVLICFTYSMLIGLPLVFSAAHFFPNKPNYLIYAMASAECLGCLLLGQRCVIKLRMLFLPTPEKTMLK